MVGRRDFGSYCRAEANGIVALLVSNIGWGVLPLYWRALSSMNAISVLSYRLLATLITMVTLLMATRRYRAYHRAIVSPWYNKKLFAMELAAAGVGMFAAQSSTFPWMAIVLAASFSVYELLKRYVPLDAAQATTFETESVILLALLWLAFQPRLGLPAPLTWPVALLLTFSGLATAIPLVTFAYGVQHSHYLTVSFIQYLNPLIQFCVAVLLLHEPIRPQGYAAFAVIWVAIVVYSFGAIRAYWERLAASNTPPATISSMVVPQKPALAQFEVMFEGTPRQRTTLIPSLCSRLWMIWRCACDAIWRMWRNSPTPLPRAKH